ncbi:MAG: glycosyl hydrolase 2 galactose-binding domain-containing protein [Flavisolibacter sp.]
MKYSTFFLMLMVSILANCQTGSINQIRLNDFKLLSSSLINTSPEILSSAGYHSNSYWFPAKVPGTVLTTLVANHVYPDPYSGLNNMLIPDASDSFNHRYNLEQYSYLANEPNPWKKPYWYRTSFQIPATDAGKTFQLIFKGINYRADVWVNGHQIADSSQMAGMFAEYSLDVTKVVNPGSQNILAVKIYPLDYPGLPSTEQLNALGDFYPNGGPTGDIGKNVTMLCSVGWDWMPPVRDRNMGIWQPVYLRTTGNITIGQVQVKTDLPRLPNTSIADLSLKLKLFNHNSNTTTGQLKISIAPENFTGSQISFSKQVAISGSSEKEIDLSTQQLKQLQIHSPHLWWPNGYGKANLYKIKLSYSANGKILDDTSLVFGIRTVSSNATNVNGFFRREFFVNGKRVHLVGGAWVPDMMLNRDSIRFDHELLLCKNANVNLVRIWGGGIAPPDIFFEIADKYGLMVWEDFWVTGDTQGEFKGSPDWPLQGNIFVRNVISTILRIRNHPSLLVWTGGNEGHARKELYDAMRTNISLLDGTRPFIPSSSGFAKLPSGWEGSWPDNNPSGVYSGGPYTWRDPADYYRFVDQGRDWVFKDETGLPSQPPYSTLLKIIPNLTWDTTLPYPFNNSWGYHDACSGNGKYDLYYKEMVTRYGQPHDLQDFSQKMQLMNAVGYQGIFEAAGHKLNQNGGVMLWKLNAALPSVIWQIYDWYLEPNAGYYFMQNACEPLHVQLNLDDSTVAVINRSYKTFNDLLVVASVYDMNGKSVLMKTSKINLDTTEVKETISLRSVLGQSEGISFVILDLKNAANKLISHNAYWFAPLHDFKNLSSLKKANVQVQLKSKVMVDSQIKYRFHFTNVSDIVAFFIQPQINENGDGLRPVFWSSDYFTLAPHASLDVEVAIPKNLHSVNPIIKVGGWNVNELTIPFK